MEDRNLVRAFGDLGMYRTSPGTYSICSEDKCLVSNLSSEDAYAIWDRLIRDGGDDKSATQLSFPLSSSNWGKSTRPIELSEGGQMIMPLESPDWGKQIGPKFW